MRSVGQAAQTMAALYSFCGQNDSTFASVAAIAERACLSERTVKRHLRELVQSKLIESRGREAIGRRGRRRTITYELTQSAIEQRRPFAMLPHLAAEKLRSWAERAVFAVVCSNSGFDGPLSVAAIRGKTGLSERSVQEAKSELASHQWIDVAHGAQGIHVGDMIGVAAGNPMPTRGAEMSPTSEGEGCRIGTRTGAEMALVGVQNWHSLLIDSVNENLTGQNAKSPPTRRAADQRNSITKEYELSAGTVSIAEGIFRAISGRTRITDAAIVWQAAELQARGVLQPRWVDDAANATKNRRPASPPAYFRRVLNEWCQKNGLSLTRLLSTVRLKDPRFNVAPAKHVSSLSRGLLRSLPQQEPNVDDETLKARALRELDRAMRLRTSA